ncbi:MAG: metalloregulator ArsR/SmtB family transcription factor [Nitrospinae bacterium]|nr:metalloregulator ArsR/SmtB family transcription factor [Nitrospinota bacterium]
MSSVSRKGEIYAHLANAGKALAHGARLELLEYMSQGERSVEELAELSGMPVANVSQHLQKLGRAGMAVSRKEGQRVYYSISGMEVVALLSALRSVAEKNLAEIRGVVDRYLKVKDSLEPVRARELLKLAKKGSVTVIDVRPPEEYVQGHLAGAVNVPLKELEWRLKDIPKAGEVVAYCRGPYCVMAFEAVVALRKKGYRARRLADGFPEWKQAGLPVAAGTGKS